MHALAHGHARPAAIARAAFGSQKANGSMMARIRRVVWWLVDRGAATIGGGEWKLTKAGISIWMRQRRGHA